MRVIGGRFRSRRLPASPPEGTRPTGDRLRETVFNILGPRVLESRFLDVYAGVGAMGIEALSRGASEVVFVDSSPNACRSIRRNLESLGIGIDDHVEIRQEELPRVVSGKGGYDIVYLDPPYDRMDLYRRDLALLADRAVLSPAAVVIAEHGRKAHLPDRQDGLERSRVHPQGTSALSFYRWETEWRTESN